MKLRPKFKTKHQFKSKQLEPTQNTPSTSVVFFVPFILFLPNETTLPLTCRHNQRGSNPSCSPSVSHFSLCSIIAIIVAFSPPELLYSPFFHSCCMFVFSSPALLWPPSLSLRHFLPSSSSDLVFSFDLVPLIR
ncbi:hypothetical protein RND81_12G089100 [Saponaria officinalis]|uniref:Transmembrane protein n=1 Tax=Saponaria officinalis TaxID=3572 RepID=A0AAW1H8A8_SAPOF